MPLQNQSYYRRLVEDELREGGFLEPPVPIESVAGHLGVPVRELALPLWFTAALIYEDGLPTILLNSVRPTAVKRAGLGHLLGHILIVLDGQEPHYPRATLPQHDAADMMAAEFATPEFMVRDQAQKWFNDYRYLAGLFGVTEERMFEAMRNLGLIKSKGVLWDY
ncbi:MAG: ImmA/IrrE family metallo-endopeptidase [Actinobacteria bacterium]|nr:ImmA/IrrE family metallo-endopeptidase [Actinomycetota bacterium]